MLEFAFIIMTVVKANAQLTFTCSKSTIKMKEKGVKYLRNIVEYISHIFLVFLLLLVALNK